MVTTQEHLKQVLSNIHKTNKDINALLYVNKEAEKEAEEIDKKISNGKAGKLAGKVIAVKSCINVMDFPISCASKTLEGYKGVFDADAIARIKQEDGIIIGMSNMDEFACGVSGETSAFGPTKNPASTSLIPGGTSSGSAAAVAAGYCDMALGTDTGGSIRNIHSSCLSTARTDTP